MDECDRETRNFLYQHFARTADTPGAADVAAEFELS